MAIESPIEKADGWFVNEDKLLQFTVYKQDNRTVENITGWTFTFQLFRRRETTPVLEKVSQAGITVTNGPAGIVSVQINAEDTAALAGGSYQFVLRRADTGSRQVLSFGGAALQSAVLA